MAQIVYTLVPDAAETGALSLQFFEQPRLPSRFQVVGEPGLDRSDSGRRGPPSRPSSRNARSAAKAAKDRAAATPAKAASNASAAAPPAEQDVFAGIDSDDGGYHEVELVAACTCCQWPCNWQQLVVCCIPDQRARPLPVCTLHLQEPF